MELINILMILCVLAPAALPRVLGDALTDGSAPKPGKLTTPQASYNIQQGDSRTTTAGLAGGHVLNVISTTPVSLISATNFASHGVASSPVSLESAISSVSSGSLTSQVSPESAVSSVSSGSPTSQVSPEAATSFVYPESPSRQVSLESATSPVPHESATKSVTPGAASGSESLAMGTSSPMESCPVIGGPQVAGSIVKCYCQGDEILEEGQCRPYDGKTVIPVLKDFLYPWEEDTTNYDVAVEDINCDPAKHLSFNFTKGQFHLRPRGDMVLLQNAGELEGQRINKYCLIYHLNSYGDLTYMIKACVPIPSVPRCCPPGLAMKDGSCQPARTPQLLRPPISAKPFSKSVAWSNITNYVSPLKCESEPMITIPLKYKQSNLLSLADGVVNGWVPDEEDKRRVYYQCPEYCVDGIENSDGSTDYFTSFCYISPTEAFQKSCPDGKCINKCCKKGYSVDVNRFSCVPDSSNAFSPPGLSSFNVVTGWPVCNAITKAEGVVNIGMDGSLNAEDRVIPTTDFCIDTFISNDIREQSALICLNDTPTWLKVRPVLFSICQVISLMFLITTIFYLLLSPRLLASEGLHLFCYAVSLCIAYSASLAVHISGETIGDAACFRIAIVMQFGFLATYFWLNVMSCETWRETRSLRDNLPIKLYQRSTYALYGWGIPLGICIITIVMQNLAPDNVWGVIKPYIGVSRCWFYDDAALLVYFYGPIGILSACNVLLLALARLNYRQVTKTSRNKGNQIENDQEKKSSTEITGRVKGFSTRLNLLTFVVVCWCTEVISWKVVPVELWALTDTLNSLQGTYVLLLLLSRTWRAPPTDSKGKNLLTVSKKIFGKLRKSFRYEVNSSDSRRSEFNAAV
ncbi:uncharacterized protein [Macrobrachium rosenbergii]|uniref:uncharacterized protein n=1 Tax=Macrobrachium rosenbergii TaxID=79674 RepID=UPI0034D5EDD5